MSVQLMPSNHSLGYIFLAICPQTLQVSSGSETVLILFY